MESKITVSLVLFFITKLISANVIPNTEQYCTQHLRTKTHKTIVRFFDARDSSQLNETQSTLWRKVLENFSDYPSISFVDIDISNCPNLLDDFYDKTLPAYGMMSDKVLLALCNAPHDFQQMYNYFFDFSTRSYKKLKNFKLYSGELCTVTYPEKKGIFVFSDDHDDKIKNGTSFVIYFAPKCRYCLQFYGFWNALYDYFYPKVKFFYFDCMSDREFCVKNGAYGWPTLYAYKGDKKEEYTGKEDLNEIVKFLYEIQKS